MLSAPGNLRATRRNKRRAIYTTAALGPAVSADLRLGGSDALGIAGSIVATWLGRAIGWYQAGQSAGLIMSVVGAVLLLAIYHAVRKRSA